MDITEFLQDRLGEDEHAVISGVCICGDGPQRPDCADRVLAEVEAKRKIIAEHARDGKYCVRCLDDAAESWDVPCAGYPCLTVRLLAEPYSSHAGYNEAWRP